MAYGMMRRTVPCLTFWRVMAGALNRMRTRPIPGRLFPATETASLSCRPDGAAVSDGDGLVVVKEFDDCQVGLVRALEMSEVAAAGDLDEFAARDGACYLGGQVRRADQVVGESDDPARRGDVAQGLAAGPAGGRQV